MEEKVLREVQESLQAPFPENQIKWRVVATSNDKTKGLVAAYLESRDVMNRLDDVVGVENWWDQYFLAFHGDTSRTAIECKLTLRFRVSNSLATEVTKADVSDMYPKIEANTAKTGYADSFKRAAVKFGIGRYLYYLDKQWVAVEQKGKSYALKERPKLPDWATPKLEEKK